MKLTQKPLLLALSLMLVGWSAPWCAAQSARQNAFAQRAQSRAKSRAEMAQADRVRTRLRRATAALIEAENAPQPDEERIARLRNRIRQYQTVLGEQTPAADPLLSGTGVCPWGNVPENMGQGARRGASFRRGASAQQWNQPFGLQWDPAAGVGYGSAQAACGSGSMYRARRGGSGMMGGRGGAMGGGRGGGMRGGTSPAMGSTMGSGWWYGSAGSGSFGGGRGGRGMGRGRR